MKPSYYIAAIVFVLLLMVVLLFSCKDKEERKETRYFYVGYDVSNENSRNVGQFTAFYDSFPTKQMFRNIVYEHFKCSGFSMEQVIITSISEFKDSLEFIKWVNPIRKSMDTCQSPSVIN